MAVRQNTVRKSMLLPDVRHLAASFAGLLGCFRFWECWSVGGWETLATKDAKDLRHRYRVLYNECMTCGNKVRLGSACAQERFWDNS